MEKTTIVYIVQAFDDRYGFWHTCSEPQKNLFALPVSDYVSEEEAQARKTWLEERSPDGKFRVVKRTVTDEVL